MASADFETAQGESTSGPVEGRTIAKKAFGAKKISPATHGDAGLSDRCKIARVLAATRGSGRLRRSVPGSLAGPTAATLGGLLVVAVPLHGFGQAFFFAHLLKPLDHLLNAFAGS